MAAVTYTLQALESMSYRELQATAKQNNVKANGKSAELKLRLAAMLDTGASPAPLGELSTHSPSPAKAYSLFTKGAGPVHESPMKVEPSASPAKDTQLEVDTAADAAAGAAELPSPIDEDASPKIPNDGTFLDMFKAMEKEQQEQPWETLGGDSLENFAGLRAAKE